jgi:uncharacterized membrane protein
MVKKQRIKAFIKRLTASSLIRELLNMGLQVSIAISLVAKAATEHRHILLSLLYLLPPQGSKWGTF